MKKTLTKFKKGAASFYIVAFSTLILVIVAASFAMVIISEVTRTSNDDLSQSAYDSALAGIEDAKLAFANYQRCLAENPGSNPTSLSFSNEVTCQDIIYWMNHPDCDMVGHILGRIPKNDSDGGEVSISDTVEVTGGDVTSDLNQAYTCVQIKTVLEDYRSTLTSSSQTRVMRAQFDGENAKSIKYVRLSWYANDEVVAYNYSNFINSEGWRAAFQPATSTQVSTPPTIEVQLVQTAKNFELSQFDSSNGGATNRATVYLVPNGDSGAVEKSVNNGTYIGTYNGLTNVVSKSQMARTNSQTVANKPYGVHCESSTNTDEEFACSAVLELPDPIGGDRSDNTFMFAVSLPYGQPDTDFSLQFCKGTSVDSCVSAWTAGETSGEVVKLKNTQVLIDSTGRANDLYRRVEVRLESADTSFAYPYYAIQLLKEDSGSAVLEKNLTVTEEYNF